MPRMSVLALEEVDDVAAHATLIQNTGDASIAISAYKSFAFQCDVEEDLKAQSETMPQLRANVAKLRVHGTDQVGMEDLLADEEDQKGPLGFVEALWFQCMTGIIIFMNCIIIGMETDLTGGAWIFIWFLAEQSLLTFFVVELLLRICHWGWGFWQGPQRPGNLLDVCIVLSGVVDMWLMPIFHFCVTKMLGSEHGSDEGDSGDKLKVIIQMSRMLRIIRLVRLVKIVPPLYILAKGITEAVQGMFWVLVMLLMMVYMLAILGTRLIGHRLVVPESASEEALEIADMFGTIGGSMFVIFEMMSFWSLMKFTPLFDAFPATRFLAIVFYISAAWVMLAVMTGVVSEKMLAVREQLTSQDHQQAETRLAHATKLMYELFERADSNNTGNIDPEEFKAMLAHPDTEPTLRQYTEISKGDLEDVFHWMDRNGDGDLSIEEFMWGFKWLNEEFGQKSFLKMQQLLTKELEEIEQRILSQADSSLDMFLVAVQDPIKKIIVITTQLQRLDVALGGQAKRLKELCRDRITRKQLERMEAGIQDRLDKLEEAVENLDDFESEGLVVLEDPEVAHMKSSKSKASLMRSGTSVGLR